jgi:acyl phosphate:glycerol-3-phosphate acyltransferase
MEFVLAFIAYLLGSIPFGYLIVRFKEGRDVRSSGSGNIGATNVLRTSGRSGAVLTLALDAAKGYLAVWLAGAVSAGSPQAVGLAAIVVVLGHLFPVFLKFKGGKGVATVLGVFLYVSTVPVLVAAGVFLGVVVPFRYVSLGSVVAALALPVAYWLWAYPKNPSPWLLAAVLVCSALVIVKHHENLQRLRAGTERKLGVS